MTRFLRIIDSFNKWVGKASGYMILILIFVVGYEVIARYLLRQPTIWAQETSAMLFGAYIILGGAYTFYNGDHVNMDLVYSRLSVRMQALVDVITFFLFALFCLALMWKGFEAAWWSLKDLEHSGSIWNPPVYPIKIVLPLGATMLLLQGVAKFIRDIVTLVGGARP